MVTARQLEWAAGFLEGEGCFHVGVKQRIFCVSASQVQREPLDKLVLLFGGHVLLKKLHPNVKRQPIWFWSVSGARARGVMMTLYSLMSTNRKEQIKSVLARPWRLDFRVSRDGLCPRGHSSDEIYVYKGYHNQRTYRMCKACRREKWAKKAA